MEFPLASAKRLDFRYIRSYAAIGGQSPQMLVNFRNGFPAPAALSFETQVLVTVDSGADVTQLPPQFAERLGVDLSGLRQGTTGAAVGRVPAYERVPLLAYLCGEWIPLPVRFYVDAGAAVLGRAGAFEELQLAFIERDKVIYASRLGPLHR